MSSNAKHLHSIDAGHYKNTAGCETEVMPIPDIVKISMSQNIGAPCKPLVKKGDEVKVHSVYHQLHRPAQKRRGSRQNLYHGFYRLSRLQAY